MSPSEVLEPRTNLGRYRIERLLGAGGMGDVYAAHDMQLGRGVALKILSGERATDPGRVARFIREAQLASSLNHPAIVSVFDAGQIGSPVLHYLAMELVDGSTLDVWARANRDVRKLVGIFAAIADGLARAHAGGIVHRDLKPQNILVSKSGHPKVLDFGIAKLTDQENGDNGADTAPSQAMGTGAFMSPEQVEGRSIDSRSDIFSFGAVMYQALTGVSPFARSTAVESMHAVLHDEPPPIERTDVPHDVVRIVAKCLRKDREARYQSIKDVAIDLRDAQHSSPALSTKRRVLWPTAAIVFAIAVGLSIFTTASRDQTPNALIANPAPQQPLMMRLTNTGNIVGGAVTPDGNYIAYATAEGENQTIWVKQIATGTSVRVVPPAPVLYQDLAVSADGNYIFYVSAPRNEPNVMNVYEVPILGGDARLVARDCEGYIAVAPDSKRVAFIRFNAVERLYRLTIADSESGTETEIARRPFPGVFYSLAWRPDGKSITFISAKEPIEKPLRPGLFSIDVATRQIEPIATPDEWRGVGNVAWMRDGSGLLVNVYEARQPSQIWFLPLGGGRPRKITSDISRYGSMSVTADSQAIIAHRADSSANLWRISIDGSEKPVALTTGLGNCNGTGGVRWLADGRVLYTVCGATQSLNILNLNGETEEYVRGSFYTPAVSPDGRHIIAASDRTGLAELWVTEVERREFKQMTSVGPVSYPSWAPDGTTVYFLRGGREQALYRTSLQSGKTEKVFAGPLNSPTISPDGSTILCRLRSKEPKTPLWRTAIVPLADLDAPRFLDLPKSGGPPQPRWFSNNRSIAYIDYIGGMSNIWVKDLDGGEPRKVTDFQSGQIIHYDISRDGRSIVLSHAEHVNDIVLIRGFQTTAQQ